MNGQAARFKGLLHQRQEARVVDGAQGFGAAVRTDRDRGIGAGRLRLAEERAQNAGLGAGHIAGEDETPRPAAEAQGGLDAAQGTAARVALFEAGEAQPAVSLRRPDQDGAPRGQRGLRRNPGGQRHSSIEQEGLVAPHARTAASGQDERSARHETILATALLSGVRPGQEFPLSLPEMKLYNRKNISMPFCCAIAALLAAGGLLPAAGPEVRAVSTVRADLRTGRLVRTVVVRPAAGAAGEKQAGAAAPLQPVIRRVVQETAARHALDPLLVESVIRVESNFDPLAVSPKGAAGLMQLIPATAARFGAANSFDVQENIAAGVQYLKYLRDLFQDERLALAAYNAGEGAVLKYKGVPPYKETRDYVRQVQSNYEQARKSRPALPAADNLVQAQPAGEPRGRLEVTTGEDGRVYLRTR